MVACQDTCPYAHSEWELNAAKGKGKGFEKGVEKGFEKGFEPGYGPMMLGHGGLSFFKLGCRTQNRVLEELQNQQLAKSCRDCVETLASAS